MITFTDMIGIAFVAALFNVDVTAFAQLMISRPVVCAPVFGYMLGDPVAGIWIGIIVEMIWVNTIPMGAAIPQDTTAIAILATAWGILGMSGHRAAMMLALALAVPAGILFQFIDIRMRYLNIGVAHWVEKGLMDGKEKRIGQGIAAGMALSFIKAFVFYAVLIVPGTLLVRWIFFKLTPPTMAGLEAAWRLLPLAGLGVLLANFSYGRLPRGRNRQDGL